MYVYIYERAVLCEKGCVYISELVTVFDFYTLLVPPLEAIKYPTKFVSYGKTTFN